MVGINHDDVSAIFPGRPGVLARKGVGIMLGFLSALLGAN
jgi:hypothetical protein